MADLLPVSWVVRVQSKEFAVGMLLLYFSTSNGAAPTVATVASAKTELSAAVFVSVIPSFSIFRRKM